jgi:hypothetical protein
MLFNGVANANRCSEGPTRGIALDTPGNSGHCLINRQDKTIDYFSSRPQVYQTVLWAGKNRQIHGGEVIRKITLDKCQWSTAFPTRNEFTKRCLVVLGQNKSIVAKYSDKPRIFHLERIFTNTVINSAQKFNTYQYYGIRMYYERAYNGRPRDAESSLGSNTVHEEDMTPDMVEYLPE